MVAFQRMAAARVAAVAIFSALGGPFSSSYRYYQLWRTAARGLLLLQLLGTRSSCSVRRFTPRVSRSSQHNIRKREEEEHLDTLRAAGVRGLVRCYATHARLGGLFARAGGRRDQTEILRARGGFWPRTFSRSSLLPAVSLCAAES